MVGWVAVPKKGNDVEGNVPLFLGAMLEPKTCEANGKKSNLMYLGQVCQKPYCQPSAIRTVLL